MANETPEPTPASRPSPAQQAWLDATPSGAARVITERVGEVSIAYTVDRRVVRMESVKVDNGVGVQLG